MVAYVADRRSVVMTVGRHRKTWLAWLWRQWTLYFPPQQKSIILDDVEWGKALKAMARRRMEPITWQALGIAAYTR